MATRLALLAGSAVGLATAGALGGPTGEQVVAGQASFARAGNLTTITAGNNAVINYRSFDISAAESVRFIQPSTTARVLNRIQSSTPTRIDGALTANGIVYLVNPAGVMFGRTSVVDVAGLYAAAGRLSDSDFLAGVNHFTELSGNITTDGLISAHDAALVAKRIENTGRIISDGGLVTMVIGNDVYVRESGRRMYVRIDGVDVDPSAAPAPGSPQAVASASQQAGIRNSGTISSPGGIVTLGAGDSLALAIHNSGTITAQGGSVAASSRSGTVRNDGLIDVSVGSGGAGSVTLQGPMVAVTGRIDAGAGQGAGGTISLSSSVGTVVTGSAVVTAAGGSGLASGGSIVIKSGGDTFIGKLVRVDISGGAGGGDGGYLDLSAGKRLGVYGVLVGTAASGYKPALVLFDPDYLLIATPGASDGQLLDGTILGGDAGQVFVVSPEAIQNFAGDVRLEARIDLGIVASLQKVNGGLFLLAGRDIRLGSLVGPGVCGAPYGGSCGPGLTVRAGSIDFRAGGSIRDYSYRGTNLEATSGDITLVGEGGVVQYGLLTVPSRGGITIRQANSLVFDPRRLRSAGPIALSLDVTAGSLSFQGAECGGGGTPTYLTLDAHASGNVGINVPLVVLQDASITSNANVNVGADLRAGGSLVLHAGLDGTGNLSFTRCGVDLSGQTITLLAGNGTGTSARVDARTNSPTFRGAGGGATRPDAFAVVQDASIGDANLPRACQFGAPIAGMVYTLESRGGSVSLSDPSLLRGTLLTLAGHTGTTINGPLDLVSLLVNGPARLGANVTTSQGQAYTGPVVLVADVTLTGTRVHFEGPVDSSTGHEGLVIHGALDADGPIGAASPLESLVVFGPADLCSGLVITTLGQHYVGDVTLCRDTVLTSTTGADVRFDAGVDGTPGGAPEMLTINGGLIANGAIGSRDALGGLSVSGLARLNGGEVATRDGGQTYAGGILLGANAILSNIGTGVISFAGHVDAAPGLTPTLVIQGALVSTADIGLSGPLGSLQVLGPGTLCGHIVTVDGQNYGPIVLCGDLTTESTSGAEITFNTIDATKGGPMESLHVIGAAIFGGRVGGVEPLGSLTVDGRTEIDTLGIRTFGDQRYNGDVVIGKNTVTLESVNNGTVYFGGRVDGIPGRPFVGLTILGNMHADGPIGTIQPLESLDVSGASEICGGLIRTVGHQTYGGDVTLCQDTILESTTGGTITFDAAVDGTNPGQESLTILGDLVANGPIGANVPLEALTVRGDSTLNGGLVRTQGDQTYDGSVALGNNTSLESLGNGTILFTGPVDTAPGAGGPVALAILGNMHADAPIGGVRPLQSLEVSGNSEICGGLVRTVAGQMYRGDVTLCQDTILQSTSGGTITLGGHTDGTTPGQESLTILGNLALYGPIGSRVPLEALTVRGDAALNDSYVGTFGDQTYGGAVTLGSSMTLETRAGTVLFEGPVDAALGAGRPINLDILGNMHAEGPIGATNPLDSLSVSGASEVCGGLIRTVGGQNYGGDVTLCQDTTFQSTSDGTITFDAAVDGTHPGQESLTVLGDLVANGRIGAHVPLEALTVHGDSTLNGGLVRTQGDQDYLGAVSLGTATMLASDSGGTIHFGGSVDAAPGAASPVFLDIGGNLHADGPIGATRPLDQLLVHGTSEICGGLVSTIGEQRYVGDVVLCEDTTMRVAEAGFLVRFDGRVDGTHPGQESLTINGDLMASGPIGGLVPLEFLTVLGTSRLEGGLVRTQGDQAYAGPVTLGGPMTMESLGGGTVHFGADVEDPTGSTLTILGNLVAEGAIGRDSPLGSLSVSGASEICGGLVRTHLDQTYGGPVVLCQDTLLESVSNGTIAFGSTVDGTNAGQESLTIRAARVDFHGAVGESAPLEFLDIRTSSIFGLGTINLDGGLVRAQGAQIYGGNVALGRDTVLQSLGNATVQFAGAVDGANGQTPRALSVLGNMHADGPFGSNNPLASLDVSGDSEICGGSITTIAGQFYGGHVFLCHDTVLTSTSGGVISFADAVDAEDGNNASLTIRGIMDAHGPIGAQDPLGFLEVFGTSTLGGGLVRTTASQTYHDSVTLGADTLIQSLAAGVVRFDSGIDSAGGSGELAPRDLSIEILPVVGEGGVNRGRIEFGGDLGGIVGLRDVRLCTGGDEINDIPAVATIIGLRSISIHARDFVMCPLEKFTTLGDLTLDASRRAVLGDLVTVGDMAVRSGSIELQRRDASGLVRASDGSLVRDRGLDFVAGGEMVFTGPVTLSGSGPAPTFSSGSGNAPASLAGFEFTRTPAGDASRSALIFEGVVLDQRTRGTTIPPGPPEDVKAALAGAVQPPRFRDSVRPRAFDLGAMARLGLEARPVTPEEAQGALHGRYTFNDLPQDIAGFATGERTFAGTRVDLASVLRAVDRYNALNRVPGTTGTALHPVGQPVPADQLQESAKVIAEAADRFRAQAGGWDPGAFRHYLDQTPSERAAHQYVQTLAELVSSLRGMGLPVVEFERSRAHLLGGLADATGMPVPELLKLVEPVVKAEG